MGILDSFLNESKTDEGVLSDISDSTSIAPFSVSMSFTPLRLSAMQANKVDLIVKVTNLMREKKLVSVDVAVPKNTLIGFDRTCLNKSVEKKAGELSPGESAEIAVPIWATNQTKSDEIPIEVTAFAHYQDYNKVLASVRKRTTLRIV